MGNFSKLINSRATSLIASVYFAAQGFSLSLGGMEQMKPVFLFCFALFFCLAFAFSWFRLVNYVRERKRKNFHFLRRQFTRFLLYLCRSSEPSIIVSNFVFFRLAASAKSEITA